MVVDCPNGRAPLGTGVTLPPVSQSFRKTFGINVEKRKGVCDPEPCRQVSHLSISLAISFRYEGHHPVRHAVGVAD